MNDSVFVSMFVVCLFDHPIAVVCLFVCVSTNDYVLVATTKVLMKRVMMIFLLKQLFLNDAKQITSV